MKITENDILEYEEISDFDLQNNKNIFLFFIKNLDPNWTLRRCSISIMTKLIEIYGPQKILIPSLKNALQIFLTNLTISTDPLEKYF